MPVRIAHFVLAAALVACGGGGSGSGSLDTGAPLASGPPAAGPSVPPAPGATPPAANPAPVPAPPAIAYAARLLDPLGQAGMPSLNNHGQAAWTTTDANRPFARFFDGTQVLEVIGNRPARATAVNDAGQVTGQIVGDSSSLPYRWRPEAPDEVVVIDLQPGVFGVANAINANGVVAGKTTRRNVPFAFRWTPPTRPGTLQTLEPLSGADTLPAVDDGQFINASGTVAGVSSVAVGDPRVHAAVWQPGQPVRDLGTLGGPDAAVAALNDAGLVAGQADLAAGTHHAYRWSAAEGMVDLGTLGGANSSASAMNAGGTVVGTSETADPGSTRAFVWTGGAMQSLGTLGGGWSAATTVNASGQVGGTSADANGMAHAFLWTAAGGMVDLNTRLPTETNRVLQSVVALADDGSMLVSASDGLLLLRPRAP